MYAIKRHSRRLLWLSLVLVLPAAYLYQLFPHAHDAPGTHHQPSSHEAVASHHDHDRPHSHAHPHSHDEPAVPADEDRDQADHGRHHHSLTDHLDSHFFPVSGPEFGADQVIVAELRGVDQGIRKASVPYLIPEPDRLPPHLIFLPSSGLRAPPSTA